MTKLLAITFLAAALAACSSMSGTSRTSSMGNAPVAGSPDLQHSTDRAAAKNGNPAAVSPGGGQ
jgi:hypothetical protein